MSGLGSAEPSHTPLPSLPSPTMLRRASPVFARTRSASNHPQCGWGISGCGRDPSTSIYSNEARLPSAQEPWSSRLRNPAFVRSKPMPLAMPPPSTPHPGDAALDAEDGDATSMSPFPSPSWSSEAIRFLLPSLGDTEDLERYAPGGFHPVSLGDVYDERYRVVHKLGAGGFSTVWLARDDTEQRWVSLKIVVADHSEAFETKHVATQQAALRCGSQANSKLAVEYRRFTIDGPNGRHLCLVLPVLGPSASQLSCYLESRITPRLARKAAYQAAQALANLHAQGLCHGGKLPTHSNFPHSRSCPTANSYTRRDDA